MIDTRRKTRRAPERGFTLVEVMIVIAIIGLISGIVGYNVLKSRGDANRDAVEISAKQFDNFIILYVNDTGQYPQALEDLMTDPGIEGWNGPYFKGGPDKLRDPWKRPFLFEYIGSGDPPYRIGSYGADGSPGGQGEGEDIWYPEVGSGY